MRKAFINTLCELAAIDQKIFLLCGDLGYSVLETFAERFPDRYINVGIAEQNMAQLATGLSLSGYTVFTYSIGNFATLRCMEQIRHDICYHEANVKIVAVGGGYAYGQQGVSHHATEDIAMLRAIPGMTICAPGDPVETAAIVRYLSTSEGPAYLRLNRAGEDNIHESKQALRLLPGHLVLIRSGQHTAVLTTGAVLQQTVKELQASTAPWALYSSPFVGQYDVQELTTLARTFHRFITIEEHQLNGGFGSAIVEAFSDLYAAGTIKQMPSIKRLGIPNHFIHYAGSQDFLRRQAGISLWNASGFSKSGSTQNCDAQ